MQTYLRLRITTDDFRGFFSDPQPFGYQADGEIEDHEVDADTLPVSIHSFRSSFVDGGLLVEFGTVSETRNIGFNIWGDRGNGFETLNAKLIPSNADDAVTPQTYSVLIPNVASGGVTDLAVTAMDSEGEEKMYGLFVADREYGRDNAPAPINWARIQSEISQSLQTRGYERDGAGWRAVNNGTVTGVDLRVTQPGMQRVTFEQLLQAGLNLSGVDAQQIAVTRNGQPVARKVELAGGFQSAPVGDSILYDARGPETRFGPGSSIEFWGDLPDLPDSLYVEHYVYRISVNAPAARQALVSAREPQFGLESYVDTAVVNEDLVYNFASPLADPWYAARLRAGTADDRYDVSVDLGENVLAGEPASLKVTLAGLTDLDASPDHHVRISLNGQVLGEQFFEGRIVPELNFDVPAGLLQSGANTVSVELPGGSAAATDIVLVDRVAIDLTRILQSDNGTTVLLPNMADTGGMAVAGFGSAKAVAYGRHGDNLTALPVSVIGRGLVQIPTVQGTAADIWISHPDAMFQPEVVGTVGANELLSGNFDFLVIAHPAFLPASPTEIHPLNTFVAHRQAQGWQVAVADLAEVQAHYGGGMPLPGAVTRFLDAASDVASFEHVLLVGGDSYDYLNRLGLGSLSFLPTRYAETRFIPHAPSDALLGDINGDGLSDKAIGRWPVRSVADLSSVVTKTLDWENNGVGSLQSALWVTDSDDPSVASFENQAERMISPLVDAGWSQNGIERVYFEQYLTAGSGDPAGTARQDMFAALEQGRALTGFAGHGAPSMWTFQGLLTPTDIANLDNEGSPTLIGTLTCYTSYFVSPYTDTVAHRLMNGFKTDALGNPIDGAANGAVAIHGAATLSNYAQNEIFAREVLRLQLAGETLGQAVQGARQLAADRGIDDLVINWALLGDPTLRLQ